MIIGMKFGADLRVWIAGAGAAVAVAGCSPREFKDRAGEIQLWAQRSFAESQAYYGDNYPANGGGGVYPRPQTDPAAERAAAEKAAAAAAPPPPPKQQYVIIIP